MNYNAVIDGIHKNISSKLRLYIGPTFYGHLDLTYTHHLTSLGVHNFVLPYERYKKLIRHDPTEPDPSAAFGFDTYSDSTGTELSNDYPRTIIHTWEPGDNQKTTWFADTIRNLFAYG
jgi:hypothetical protein